MAKPTAPNRATMAVMSKAVFTQLPNMVLLS
jgi:hypothetical protein